MEKTTGAKKAKPEVLLWHDLVHESQDLTRLHFWRLSFSPSYDHDAIFSKLRTLFAKVGITSYGIYETLGDYDLLLRMWVPRDIGPEELEVNLVDLLSPLKLWNRNFFICHTAEHWADVQTDSEKWPDLDEQVVAEVSEFNAAQTGGEVVARSAAIDKLVSVGTLKTVPTDTRGIRLFVVFDHLRAAFPPGSRRQALGTIKSTCSRILEDWKKKHPGTLDPQISIYEGTGTMTEFLVMARAPHAYFHDFVREMAVALRRSDLDNDYDIRPYTHVIADRMFSEFVEDRPQPPERKVDINLEETESLEYKASFALDVRGYLATGKQARDKRIKEGVVQAACGLLNSPEGGKLVIGVLETRRELGKTKDKLALLESLRDEFGFEMDPEQLSDPPNALIGIEAEVGEGKNYGDADAYQRALNETLRSKIEPNPMSSIKLEIRKEGERSLCILDVSPGKHWFWAKSMDGKEEDFFVREAGSTRAYGGHEGELFREAHPRD
jgi:hypothetical protein